MSKWMCTYSKHMDRTNWTTKTSKIEDTKLGGYGMGVGVLGSLGVEK